jgi:hypothetical protein
VNWLGGLQTPRRLSKTRISLLVILINLFSLSLYKFLKGYSPPSSHQDLSPGAEDGEVVAAGDGEWGASGRKGHDGYARWECHRVFFILRNGERMKVKGNRPIGLVVHRPRKA